MGSALDRLIASHSDSEPPPSGGPLPTSPSALDSLIAAHQARHGGPPASPSAGEQAISGLKQVGQFFRHPIDAIEGIVTGAGHSIADAVSPVAGTSNVTPGATRFGDDAAIAASRNPHTYQMGEPGVVAPSTQKRGLVNTAANVGFLAAPELAAPLRVGVNAGLGAMNDPEQPYRGAVAGTVLGEVLHAPQAVRHVTDFGDGMVEAGVRGMQDQVGEQSKLWNDGRRPAKTLPENQRPAVEPPPEAHTVSAGGEEMSALDKLIAGHTYRATHGGLPERPEIVRRPRESIPVDQRSPVEPPPDATTQTFGGNVRRRPGGVKLTESAEIAPPKPADVLQLNGQQDGSQTPTPRPDVATVQRMVHEGQLDVKDVPAVLRGEQPFTPLQPKLDMSMATKLFNAADGAKVGTIGDFLVGPRIRDLYRGVLHLPVFRQDPAKTTAFGKAQAGEAGFTPEGGLGIWVSPLAAPRGQFTEAMLHEAAHLMRWMRGREMGEPEESFDAYRASVPEQSAEKMVQHALALREDPVAPTEPQPVSYGPRGPIDDTKPTLTPLVSSNGSFEARPGVLAKVNKEIGVQSDAAPIPVPPGRNAFESQPSVDPAAVRSFGGDAPPETPLARATPPAMDAAPTPEPRPSDILNVAKLNLGDQTAEQRVAQQLEQYRAMRDANRQTFAEADVNRAAIIKELTASDPKALAPAAAKRLSGEELLARRDVVRQNDQMIAELSKVIESKTLPLADHEQAVALLQKAVQHNDALLSDLVLGSSQKGRDLNLLRRMANRSLDPDVWMVQAKRMLGDKPLTDEMQATIRRLSQDAVDACGSAA